jgi:hypothetical protein
MLRSHFPPIRRLAVLFLALWLAFASSAQAATPPAFRNHAPQTDLPADWQLITNEAEGFQLAIPGHWQAVELSESAIGLGLSLSGQQNPALQPLVENPFFQQMMVDGLKFLALDLSDTALEYALPPNVNLIKVTVGGDLPLTALQKLNERQLATLADPDYDLASEILTLHGSEVIFFQYVVKREMAFQPAELTAIHQILAVNEGNQYILTVSVPLIAIEEYSDTVRTLLASFQVFTEKAAPIPNLLPTATPAPSVFAVVQVDKLNVRHGPGVNYRILGSVNRNDRLPVTGRANGRCDWFQVQLSSGQIGWIAGPPTYSKLEGDCNAVPQTVTPTPPPPPTKPCVRFDNHFNKVADVTLTSPGNASFSQKFNIAAHGRQTQCLASGRYTFSIGVPGVGNINGEFTLERGDGLLVIPIYQEFN